MINLHPHAENWGVRPILFCFGEIKIYSYPFFVSLALIVGLGTYYLLSKKEGPFTEKSFYVLAAGVLGGILGSKIPMWIMNFPLIVKSYPDITPLLSGRTIVGGLVGGSLAVLYIKKKLGIREKKGNYFAPAIALGVAIGRMGCFLRGCCYGIRTNLVWGVDFGDGVLRHPVQLYEAGFMLGVFLFFMYKRKTAKPGYLYFLLMNNYFIFRFFEEFLRESVRYYGLTVFQFFSVGILCFVNAKHLRERDGNQ